MPSELSTFIDLLTRPEFIVGVIAALVGLAIFLFVQSESGIPGWGLALVVATLIGIHVTIGQEVGLVVATGLLVAGGWLLGRHLDEKWGALDKMWAVFAWLVLGSGAAVLSLGSGLPDTGWIVLATPIAALVAGALLRSWAMLPQRHLLGPLFLITSFGIWSTVPETNTARVLLGAAVPLAFATSSGVDARISSPGAFALAAAVVWIGATGGAARHGAIIASWACLGALLVLPAIRHRIANIRPLVLITAHGAWVLIVARVFGIWEPATATAAAVMATITVIVVASVVVAKLRPGSD